MIQIEIRSLKDNLHSANSETLLTVRVKEIQILYNVVEKEIIFFYDGIRGDKLQHVYRITIGTEPERVFPAADHIRSKIRPTLNL